LRPSKYFEIYKQALRDACAIDFADMVPLVVRAMTENEACRRSITSAYDHVLVDEYQDVNPGQVGLIDHFVNDGVRLLNQVSARNSYLNTTELAEYMKGQQDAGSGSLSDILPFRRPTGR
jgi:superfamily I DNA/RNA helicase